MSRYELYRAIVILYVSLTALALCGGAVRLLCGGELVLGAVVLLVDVGFLAFWYGLVSGRLEP